MNSSSSIFVLAFVFSAFGAGVSDSRQAASRLSSAGAPQLEAGPRQGPRRGLEAVRRWNKIAIDASGFDHTPAAAGENRVFWQQFGPGRSSRAMAIVHIAMFDTINAVVGEYESYSGVRAAHPPISLPAAISQAAHDTLAALFSAQAAGFDQRLAEDLAGIANKEAKAGGIDLGRRVAAAILALKANDGSEIPEPPMGTDYVPSDEPGKWRMDPISLFPYAIGAHWGECTPFVLQTGSQFRVPPFPAMASTEYTEAFNEAKRIGGDGVITPTERTADQTHAGVFWAYDGTPSLCAPPRLYNQITVHIADQMGTDGIELARLLALVNVAMADAGIAIWESKYYYAMWRPITGIRESDPGTGPTGAGDGNPATIGDPMWAPLGAPGSNLAGPNFTPPFPSYPSGHAGFGAALFQTLRRFYGTDNIAFTFVSDEFNGVTRDSEGNARPLMPRSFSSLSQAEDENGQSRIYLGIHWKFDKIESIKLGRRVGNYVFDNVFLRLRHESQSEGQ